MRDKIIECGEGLGSRNRQIELLDTPDGVRTGNDEVGNRLPGNCVGRKAQRRRYRSSIVPTTILAVEIPHTTGGLPV